jgi:uncharacterized membrane protein YfhO
MIGVLLMSGSYAFITANELRNYDANAIKIIKGIRKEFLTADTQKVLIFAVLTFAAVAGFLFKKIKTEYFIIIILLLSSIELFTTSNRAYKLMSLNDPDQLELTEFRNTSITDILKKDNTNSRAVVLGRGFTDNHYAYFYPLISGYSAIKLQLIQDIVEHNLYAGNSKSGINWNIINMLGGKYIITQQALPDSGLTPVAQDKARKDLMYLNPNAFAKGWFVKELRKLKTKEDVVLFMNRAEFNPADIALTVSADVKENERFSGVGNVELTDYEPNRLSFKTSSNDNQFLATAETYFPKGWRAYIDGKETGIIQINHIIRGIEVPAGEHIIKFEFEPSSYYTSISLVWVGNIFTLLLIGIPFFLEFKKKKAEA